jgi:TatD DNase family protein
LANKSSESGIIDSGCNFVSRRFENDLSRVIQRALTGGVDAMIIVSNDFDKQDVVSLLVKQYSGSLFAGVGIHPDNVKRANDKLFQQRQESLKDIAVMPETVAVVCGLDWTREFATRYPQEKLLVNHFELAAEVDLPVVVCTIGDGAAEKLAEKLNDPTLPKVSGVAVYNFMGTPAEMDMLLAVTSVPVYIMISGVICDPSNAKGQEIRGLVSKIPRDRLLLCSDSPKFTPQNIDDPYIRDQKNEPSNMPWVVKEIAAALDVPVAEIGAAMRANGKTFFKLHDKGEGPVETAPAAAAASQSAARQEDDSDSDDNGVYDDFDSDDYADAPKSDVVIPANPGKPLEIGPRTPAPLQTPSAIIASREESESGKSSSSGSKQQAAAASKEARYACILCRNGLATSKDIIPHDQGLEQLKDLKRAKNDVEFDSANVMFVHEVQWMKDLSTHERKESSVPLAEGKLDCPKCGSKRTLFQALRSHIYSRNS